MGSLGADEAGEDMTVGRTNKSDERTRLVAISGENAPNGYADDFVLDVAIANNAVLTAGSFGVDAIHATGTVALPTGGAIGVIPPGNGIIGRGLNGLVGYPHATSRDKAEEGAVGAGVLGCGNVAAIGVFGRGQTGVAGYEQGTPRDTAFEAQEKAGVFGRGETGVTGDGANGPGVHGRGGPGVRGDGVNGLPGVLGRGGTGVYAEGVGGPGIMGVATDTDRGGVFQSRRMAQVRLVPLDDAISSPAQLPTAEPGDLVVLETREERGRRVASLWFCTVGGVGAAANWVKIA